MNLQDTRQSHPIQDACAPYRKEMICNLVIDVILLLTVTLFLFLVGAQWFLLIVLPLMLICAFLFNYRIPLAALREHRRDDVVTATVDILGGREDHTPTGLFGSVLRELYPRNLRVARYRIICRTEKGEKLMLRAVMSEQKWQLLREYIDDGKLTTRAVTYGPGSRILLWFDDRGEPMDTLNHKF